MWTRPTGLVGVAPPGPAIPVVAIERLTPARASAPSAIASATSLLTAPTRSSSAAETPSSSSLARLS